MPRTAITVIVSIVIGAVVGVGGTGLVLSLVPRDQAGVATGIAPISVSTRTPTPTPTPTSTKTSKPPIHNPPKPPTSTPTDTPTPDPTETPTSDPTVTQAPDPTAVVPTTGP